MKRNILGLMQQINSLKIDMNIHKEILSTTPPEEEGKIREILGKISLMKEKIVKIKTKIQQSDTEGFALMQKIENATKSFQEKSAEKHFKQIYTSEYNGPCALDLKSGERIDCLVAGLQDKGDWIVITTDGDVKEFTKAEVIFQ